MAYYKGKLTPELQEVIIICLEKGMSNVGACGQAKIAEKTFYNWYEKGAKAKSGKYKEFHDAVDNAKHTAQSNFEAVITKAADDGKWQAAAWWLERRRRDQYAPPQKYEHKVDANVEHKASETLMEKARQKRKELHDLDH